MFAPRPTFLPKSAEEPLFCCPLLDDVLRFTSPAGVEPVLLLILSRSRFSMHCLLHVIRSAMQMPLADLNCSHSGPYRIEKPTETVNVSSSVPLSTATSLTPTLPAMARTPA